MRAKITFSGNPRLTLNSLNRLTQKLFVQRGLTNAVRGVHEKTEALAKAYLMQSVRNPDATPPGTGQITRAIQKNITSKVFRVGKSVIGGTGNIKQMNEADPIHGLNRDIKSGVSLWRILETGTKPHLITAVNANKLKFFSLMKEIVFWLGLLLGLRELK